MAPHGECPYCDRRRAASSASNSQTGKFDKKAWMRVYMVDYRRKLRERKGK